MSDSAPPSGGVVVEQDGKPKVLYTPLAHQQRFHQSTAANCIMSGGAGSGKATSLDTPIPTPDGMSSMGEVRVGDRVLSNTGQPTTVVWKSEEHVDERGTWRVKFSTGESVLCGGSHEWVTSTYLERKQGYRGTVQARAQRRLTRGDLGGRGVRRAPRRPDKWLTEDTPMRCAARRTADIAKTLRHRSQNNHAVRVAEAWELPRRDVPLDPYVLGAWLGDGDSNGGFISGIDEQVFEEIGRTQVLSDVPSRSDGKRVEGLTKQLRLLGVLNNKHVPTAYLFAHRDQRLALLQGLMDTDGSIDARQGSVEFCNTNRDLADSVRMLANSLGLKATLNEGRAMLYGKDCGPKYRVLWTGSEPVFRLARKAKHVPQHSRSTQQWRYVTSVERVPDEPLQCLQVDAPSHEFLVTAAGIPTHNSLAMRWDAYMRCLSIPRFQALILRRTMPELRRSHLTEVPFEAHDLGLAKNAWHSTNHELRCPNGSKVTFGHLEDEKAVSNYLSAEYDLIAFDELATFTLNQFMFVSSRARSTKPGIVPIVRGGTNPVGPGASWVMRYFVTKMVSEEENPGYRPEDYENIHCNLDDNPYVDEETYGARLLSLPSEALRKAMRYGEWVIEGQFFSDFTPMKDGKPWHVIEDMPTWNGRPIVEAEHIEIVCAVDWGYSATGNPGICLWFACLTDHTAICFKELVFKEMLPSQAAEAIKAASRGLRVRYTVGDTSMWDEHTGPSIAEHFATAGLSMIPADKQRIPGWITLHKWLRETVTLGVDEFPRLRFLRTGCPHTIRTLPEQVVDPTDPNDVLTKHVEDDAADALRYFVMSRPGRSYAPGPMPSPAVQQMLKEQTAHNKTWDRWAPRVL